MLIRHYRDPMLFEWVQLESDDPSARSLDDVVAKRMDGSVEYTQVKFTVNPAEYPLDWDYLLTKKPNGTSMLAKWASSFARAKENGVIHSAQLKTNRIPSPDFAACMNGTTIDLSKVPASVLALVETECGGQAQATAFFGTFAFTAGHLDLDRLESSLRDQLIPTDTDNLGWLLLREEVTRWAIHQRQPPPDGKILREHVVRLISKKRPRPMRQDFFVPEGYAPPNLTFNNTMVARVKNPKTPLTVLWGTPGRGKSTYLSYLTDKLKSEGDAVLRHHYFLTSDDSSANRASYADIAASLYDQLFSHYAKFTTGVTDKTENLRSDLKIAASNLSRQSNRLYLIVDGLDHVYRDTRRTDQINHLFNVLFPLPEGISLIVGTQRVADDQLPTKLLLSAENDDWIEIPRMDEVAVRRWLQMQDGSRPVAVRWYDRRSEEIDKIGAALFKISQGHPLHLIYAFENLIRSGEPVDEDTVLALPACPDGDIRSYYNNLWLRIGAQSRIILHMLAGSDFFWPTSGIRQCIGEYDEISFLLERNYSGIIPFHNGGLPASTERDYSTPQDGLRNAQENALSLEATSFGPDDFAGVAEAVSAPAFHYAKRKPFLTDWLRHWHGKRKSRQAIASVRAYFDSGRRTYDVEEILDTTFEVSLAAEGRDAAYPWLVEGHRRRHGWSSYFTSKDEIEARLRAAANIYPDRWKEFIRDTSTPTEFYSRRGYSFSIGFHHLVWFLLLADQTQEAKKVTSEFISILEAETEDQPIAEAVWLR